MKIAIEDEMRPEHVDREDGGRAMIWASASYPPETDATSDTEPGVYFKFHSWDDESRNHDIFKQFVGKRVRITIESLDPLDQLSEIPKEST
jgi:hypothetical protein